MVENIFGKRMKSIRNKRGITLAELSKAADRSESTIQRYEKGIVKDLDNEVVERIARKLRIQPQYLMGWTDVEVSPAVNVPLIGEIAAGLPIFAEENFEEYIQFPAELLPVGDVFFLRVKGDSMESGIPGGSLVLIRVQEEVENNEVAAVLVNGQTEATLKRVRYEGDKTYLVPDNRDYMPMLVTKEDPMRIIGKAIRVIADIK